jgi:PPP family 3-phenylpropionic acid transporter
MLQALPRFQVSALAWRLALLYAALFFVVGCYLPYIPVWLKWRGLSDDAIAFLLATPLFLRVVFTPSIAFAADWTGARRTVLILLAWGSLLSFLLLWMSGSFWQMFLAIFLLALSWPTLMPLIETVAMGGMRNSGMDYGRVRLWLRPVGRRRRCRFHHAGARHLLGADGGRRLSPAARSGG